MAPNAKRRKLATTQVEEINFDPAARQEFLTGFRKRKQQRAKHAQEVAEKRAREDRIEARKQLRQERKEEYQKAFEEHQKQLKLLNEGDNSGSDNDSGNEGSENENGDGEWEGFEEPPAVDYEAEYIDEDKYTTVTVEEMDPSREGLLRSGQEEGSDNGSDDKSGGQTQQTPEADANSKALADKKKKSQRADQPKKKKKKFRYESKEERKLTQAKQRLSKHRKAQARREQ